MKRRITLSVLAGVLALTLSCAVFGVRAEASFPAANTEKAGAAAEITAVFAAAKPVQVRNVKLSGVTEKSVTLTWKKQTDVTGYVVYRYIASSDRYVKKATVSGNRAVIQNLKSGVRYTFCVRAYRTVRGKRVYGARSEFVYPVTKPAAVKNVRVSGITDSSAKITWTDTKKRTGYVIYRYDAQDGTYKKFGKTSKNSYTAKKLKSGEKYIFKVRPYRTVSGKRTYGDFSAKVTVNVKPGNVTGLRAASVKETSVKLSWNSAAGAARYRIYVRRENAWKLLGTAKKTAYTVKELESGHDYTFAVRAYYERNGKTVYSPSYVKLKTQTLRPGRSIYLTFDDGPSQVTEYVLDTLDTYGAKAVFFVTYQPGYENVLRDIVARGHSIGVHTASHEYGEIYSSFDAWYADFMKAYNFIVSVTGVKPELYRFPGGSLSSYGSSETKAQIKQWLAANGFEYYDWNLLTGDGDPNLDLNQGYAEVVNNAAHRTVPVILMHDGSYNARTITILPSILKTLTEQGFRFDLLTKAVPPIHQGEHWDY